MDPTVIQGIINTTQGETTLQQRDVADTILELQPASSPLVKLTSKLKKSEAKNLLFEEYGSEPLPRALKITAALGADPVANVTVTLDHPEYCVAGTLIWIPLTDEVMLVSTAVLTGNTTVVRGDNVQAVAANTYAFIIGTAREQGTVVGTARKTQEIRGFNYIQHFEMPISQTLEEANTLKYGGRVSGRSLERARQAINILSDVEMSFFVGKRRSTTVGGNPITFMGGLREWITTNKHDLAGVPLTEAVFDSGLLQDFEFGSSEKWFFCPSQTAQRINTWGKNRLMVNTQLSGQYGFTITDYIVNGKILHIVSHPLFKGKTIVDPYGLGSIGFTVDLPYLEYKYFQNTGTKKGGDIKLYSDLQPNDANYIQDSWEGWVGLERRMEKAHGIWLNMA
ncbi:MAG: hypothetical protein PHY56_00040 [Candidatus Omnitrophica bacterium]|nr:hypothetical protein [Candidatus Omnitrophota bacterium]